MRKSSLLILLTVLIPSFVFAGFSVQGHVGYGEVSGYREFLEGASDYRALGATGTEVGFTLGYGRFQAFFSYLFADRGGMSTDPSVCPVLSDIPSNMTYTDYKAGLGYEFTLTPGTGLVIGAAFTGVSNHFYDEGVNHVLANEIKGYKVTSFGPYVKLTEYLDLTERTGLTLDLESRFNFLGWIRTLDPVGHRWVNHFKEKSSVVLESSFVRLGFIQRF